jgi:hypothetical protein
MKIKSNLLFFKVLTPILFLATLKIIHLFAFVIQKINLCIKYTIKYLYFY